MNLENVKLVCLMPTYNKQDTLPKAIESVMMQKADFAYKLVILDDCSTDDSYAIAKRYKAQFPDKIEIVRNTTNLKLLKSITNGYSLLKGVDYFCVLDADDWYIYDKKFADAVEFLKAHKDYVVYMTNIILLKNGVEIPYCKNKNDIIDFDWNDYKSGRGVFIQTSGVIYRNIYFKDEINEKFLKGTTEDYGEALRADGFRLPWHLKYGRAHFVNRYESIYNYTNNGIWAGKTEFEKKLISAQLCVALSIYLPDESIFYLKQAKKDYNKAVEGLKNSDRCCIINNKDLIFSIYSRTYLTNNPIFKNKSYAIKRFFQNIFSVKNLQNEHYKVITIFGYNLKLKRGVLK